MRTTRPSKAWEEKTDPRTRAALDRLGADCFALRAAAGLTQRGLAQRSGIDQGTISRFERGLAPGVHADSVARLIEALEGRLIRTTAPMSPLLRFDG